jgi:Predicted membrane protein (DUF2339)
VLVLVTGVALLVRYSFAYLGPAGRVAIGYFLSLAMLATGVRLERRREYATFAFGLIAGGWAAVYFTTYAAHAFDAARVIDSQVVGTLMLVAVATAMVAHSLKYRSQTVTALAYIVAFFTLGITPMTGFSLVASLPLAASLLVVAQRFGWTGVSTLGVASTYALFALRGALTRDALFDAEGLVPYLMLGAYWITFEIADVIGLRSAAGGERKPAPVFALNALGLVGAALVVLPQDDPDRVAAFLGVAGLSYLASAVLRRRLFGATTDIEESGVSFSTFHGATAMTAALFAWAVAIEFHGNRQTFAWLLEVELLFAAGMTMGDRTVRGMGAVAGIFVTLQAWAMVMAGLPGAQNDGWRIDPATIAAAATALAWYVNREWLRTSRRDVWAPELGYAWAAGLLVLGAIAHEVRPMYQGLAGLAFAAGLLELGLSQRVEYRRQAWLVGPAAAAWIILFFGFGPSAPTPAEVWRVLPFATVVLYASAARLARRTTQEADEWIMAAAAASVLGTAMLAILERRILPELYIGPAWAATALALAIIGTLLSISGLRWQAYLLVLAGAMRAFRPIPGSELASRGELAALAFALGCAYAITLIAHRAVESASAAGRTDDTEAAGLSAVSLAATTLLTWLLFEQVSSSRLTLAWGLEGLALLSAGFAARERILRMSGLALLLGCILKLVAYDLRELDTLTRTFSFVILGVALLAVSWTYTKYKNRNRPIDR